MNKINKVKVYTDGGARGNPGPSAIGVYVLTDDDKEIFKIGKQIGVTTNNVAEYSAVIYAIEWLIKNLDIEILERVDFYSDSSLVVNQLNGLFKVKEEHLRKMVVLIKQLEKKFSHTIYYHHIPRKNNTIADSLVNSSF